MECLKGTWLSKSFTKRCPTFVVLGSSFTLAVDADDMRACSYSSSAGSSFTLTKGGEGDLIGRVSAWTLSYIRKKKMGKKCIVVVVWTSTTRTDVEFDVDFHITAISFYMYEQADVKSKPWSFNPKQSVIMRYVGIHRVLWCIDKTL